MQAHPIPYMLLVLIIMICFHNIFILAETFLLMPKEKKKKISESLAIVSLILNILVLPGLGSIIGGKTKEGVWQIVLVIGGFFIGLLLTITIIGAIIGLPLMFLAPLAGWIWGIVTGIGLIKESN